MTKDCCAKTTDGLESINADTIVSTSITADDITTDTLVATDFVSIPDGSNTEPSLRFTSDPDTGLYYAPNTLNIAVQSVPVSSFDLNTGYITNLIPIQGPTGTNSNPAYTFQADNDTGLYRENANQVALTTGGINRLSISATGIQSTISSLAPTGSTGAPVYSFTNDSTSGLYYDTSQNCVGISHSSQKKVTVSPTGTNFYDSGTLVGSILSNGFNSNVQEIIIVELTGSPTIGTGAYATFTAYGTPDLLRGFSAPVSGVFTFPTTGIYIAFATVIYGANATGQRASRFTGTVTPMPYSVHSVNAVGGGLITDIYTPTVFTASANETVELQGFQNSGVTLAVNFYVKIMRIF